MPISETSTADNELSELEERLYERQLSLSALSTSGQLALKRSSVFISRVGGLGGTVAMLLARAGVGKLVLAHAGVVEHENLNRMPLAFRRHLGQARIDVFKETLFEINPDIAIVTSGENAQSHNITSLVAQADIIVDASPDFGERYCMNGEAVRVGKPLVMAAMNGLECYASTILPRVTPCLACIYPEAPSDWEVLGFPVVAPSSSLVASLAAMEVIKLLTGCGKPLHGRLFYADLGNNVFSSFNIERRADCRVCSQ